MINISALLEQIAHHLDEQGVTYSILKADYTNHFDPDCKVQLIMAQTLHARIGKINEQSRSWRPNYTRTSVRQ